MDSILSKELWANALGKLEDPQDRLNLIGSSCVLEEAFGDKKSEWRFEAVLPILLKTFEWSGPLQDEAVLQQSFLHCRQISKACRKAMDDYAKDYQNRGDLWRPCILPSLSLNSQNDVRSYYNLIKDSTPKERCPFLRRDMTLICQRTDDPKLSMTHISLNLMERIGQHLHGIFICPVGFSNARNLVGYLQSLFDYLPNLRNINYHLTPVKDNTPNLHWPAQPLKLPVLRKLKTLLIVIMGDEEDPNGNAIIPLAEYIRFDRFFPQLTTLFMSWELWKEEYSTEAKFSSLEILKLDNVDIMKETESQQKMLRLLENLDAPQLKYIRVATTVSNQCPSIALRKAAFFVEIMGILILAERSSAEYWKSSQELVYLDKDKNSAPEVAPEKAHYEQFYIRWCDTRTLQLQKTNVSSPMKA